MKRWLAGLLTAAFWLGAWQLLSVSIGQEILMVSPVSTFLTLARLMGTAEFYLSVGNTFGRIGLGFLIALVLGAALGVLSRFVKGARALLAPPMAAVKATPIASFVILMLIWVSARDLSVFISFLMALPLIYESTLSGLTGADKKLLEMADVFGLGAGRRARAIYAPAALPYLLAACRSAMGICWKAGVAAEVIGQPAKSIGDALYRAKLFLATDELFAWTTAVVLLSLAFEKLAVKLIGALEKRLTGAAG
jgi:NitT/TauT family transport system permease protein